MTSEELINIKIRDVLVRISNLMNKTFRARKNKYIFKWKSHFLKAKDARISSLTKLACKKSAQFINSSIHYQDTTNFRVP